MTRPSWKTHSYATRLQTKVSLIYGQTYVDILDGVRETVCIEPDDIYRAEHQAMLAGNAEGLCTLEEAMETLTTIEAAEHAAASHTWIVR